MGCVTKLILCAMLQNLVFFFSHEIHFSTQTLAKASLHVEQVPENHLFCHSCQIVSLTLMIIVSPFPFDFGPSLESL